MDNNKLLRLYPEKEVMALLNEVGTLTQKQIDWHINELDAIELPSDEDIEKAATNDAGAYFEFEFIQGAKWVIEQIKQQADGRI